MSDPTNYYVTHHIVDPERQRRIDEHMAKIDAATDALMAVVQADPEVAPLLPGQRDEYAAFFDEAAGKRNVALNPILWFGEGQPPLTIRLHKINPNQGAMRKEHYVRVEALSEELRAAVVRELQVKVTE